jgi:TonB-linked SusC/RagA family outer membrane protein
VEDTQLLDEVVVIGYGSITKKELSSAIVQVNKKDFQQGAANNAMEMLTGKVAGLNIVNTAMANPNSGADLQIRGATSLSASNSPLVVIDGVIGGNIINLSPQDIESMTVLKDAASTAIYGTRGANGVILVTTRRGSGVAGTHRITYDSWFGVNVAKPGPEVLTADEFRRSLRRTDYGASTDWYDLLLRDFSYNNNQYLALEGSTKTGNYSLSMNYKKATGLDIANERQEFGGRLAVTQRVLEDHLELSGSLNSRKVEAKGGNNDMFDTALSMNPTMPVYNADGSYYQPTSPTNANNPVSDLTINKRADDHMYTLGSVEAKLYLIRNNVHSLNTSVSYSLHYDDLKSNYYTPSTSSESFWNGRRGRARVEYQKWWQNQAEWLGNYTFDKDDHHIKVVAGYSYREEHYESTGNENMDFAYDNFLWNNMNSGSFLSEGKANMWTGKSLAKLIGLFGRINYNWRDLLIASVALRHEGSTKFGIDSKWGNFPSASLAWEIANMKFMEDLEMVNSLKPRVSYGISGRSDFDPYKSIATYGVPDITNTTTQYLMNGTWTIGYAPSINANPSLKWEKLQSINAGLDFALWNRLNGSVDWFNRQSLDLLYNYKVPQPPFIYPDMLVNVGTTENTGIEVSLNGDIVKGNDFTWHSGINYSYGTTTLKTLSNDFYKAQFYEIYKKPGVATSEYFFRTLEGSKVGQYFGYEHAGIDNSGHLLVYALDDNKNYILDENGAKIKKTLAEAINEQEQDKKYIGNGTPTSFLSWDNTFRYKNFDLNIFARGAFDFEIFNMRRYGMGLIGSGSDNVMRDAYIKYVNITQDSGGAISSFFLEKGDYFKIENITLGYNVPLTSHRFIDACRVYLSAKNVYTFTNYSGNDPSVVPVNGLGPGIDVSSAYPLATQYSIGVTLTIK